MCVLLGKAIFRIVQEQDGKGSSQETGDPGNGTVSVYEGFSWMWKTDIWVLWKAVYLPFTRELPIHQDSLGLAGTL